MESVPQFEAFLDTRNGVARVVATGELDMATAPVLKQQLELADGDGIQAMILDLRNLSFVDLAGLHVFVDAHRRAESVGRRFVLVGANRSTRRLLELTGTGFLLDGEHAVGTLGAFVQGDHDG